MSVFDYAIKMERDGEKFYREMADNTPNRGLRQVFLNLAEEEINHIKLFESLKRHTSLDVEPQTIFESSINIFTHMRESRDLEGVLDSDQKEAYEIGLEMEKQAYVFYEKKAEETDDVAEKNLLLAIAREERRHYRLLEGIIEFISRPEQWLENAEYTHLEDY